MSRSRSHPRALGRVLILGAGKLGAGLARALSAARVRVTLRALRAGLPTRALSVDVLVIATRERDFPRIVAHFLEHRVLPPRCVALHVSGALSSDAIAGLRPVTAGVAQLHPMIAFASPRTTPALAGGHAHVEGDPEAVRVARLLARAVGLAPRTFPGLDPVAYHAAAGLVANGAVALAAAGKRVLVSAGVPPQTVPLLLGPLLRSVAENVAALGLPGALTGPVRRGDAVGLGRHRATLARLAPELGPLYDQLVRAQLPSARALADAPASAFDEIEASLERTQ